MKKLIIPALLALAVTGALSLGGCEAWNALFAKHSGKEAEFKGTNAPATAGEFVAGQFGDWLVDGEDITGDTIRVKDDGSGNLTKGTVIHCVHGF